MKTRIVLSCLAAAALLTGTAPAGASTSQHDLGKLRTATKEFHNVANAEQAGFGLLADEKGIKLAQNVAAGIGGLIVWPLFFAMDLQGTADVEINALQARQQFLATLAQERCRAAPPARRR